MNYRYLDRIIRSSDLHEFEGLLLPHQKALTADGELFQFCHKCGFLFLSRSVLTLLSVSTITILFRLLVTHKLQYIEFPLAL